MMLAIILYTHTYYFEHSRIRINTVRIESDYNFRQIKHFFSLAAKLNFSESKSRFREKNSAISVYDFTIVARVTVRRNKLNEGFPNTITWRYRDGTRWEDEMRLSKS